MKRIHADISIKALPVHVWELLTDFAAYPQWNPFIRFAEGEIREGNHLRVTLHPPGSGPITYLPKVVKSDPQRELRWRGQLWLPWLCQGEHVFSIEPVSHHEVIFGQSEIMRGILSPVFLLPLESSLQRGFQLMNATLKVWAERSLFQFFYC